MRRPLRVTVVVVAVAAAGCGGDDASEASADRTSADPASKRYNFAALKRCVRERAPAEVLEVKPRGPVIGFADDGILVTDLPSSPVQETLMLTGDDAHALAAGMRRLGSYDFVDQEGVNVVIAWQRLPEPEDKAVIDPCL